MFHSKLKLGLMGLVCAMFTGCGSSDSLESTIDYLPVQFKDGGNWSIVDSKGKVVVEDEFKHQPSVVFNGMFFVRENSSYSLYNVKDVKHPVMEELADIGYYHDDVIPVTKKGERITLVEKKGKVKATLNPINGKEIRSCAAYVSEGLLAVRDEEGNWGFVDKSGNVKVKLKYEGVSPFSEGMAIARTDEKMVVIDKSGKELFTIKEDYRLLSDEFKDGKLPVADREKDVFGYLTKKGEFVKVSNKVDDVGEFTADYFSFKNDEYEWGIMNWKGEPVIKAKYSGTVPLNDGNFFVVEDDNDTECLVINKKGDKKVTFEDYKRVLPIDNGHFYFLGRTRSKYALLNEKGKPYNDDEYANVNLDFSKDGTVYSDYSEPQPEESAQPTEWATEEQAAWTEEAPATEAPATEWVEGEAVEW